jgi:hypothetical protein
MGCMDADARMGVWATKSDSPKFLKLIRFTLQSVRSHEDFNRLGKLQVATPYCVVGNFVRTEKLLE